jgi:hypothetical protein
MSHDPHDRDPMPETFVFTGPGVADAIQEFDPARDRLELGSDDQALTLTATQQGADLLLVVEARNAQGVLTSWQTLLLKDTRASDLPGNLIPDA